MTLSYFSRSDEIFLGHLDFQDDMGMTWLGLPIPDKYDKTCSNLKHLFLNQTNKNDSGSMIGLVYT